MTESRFNEESEGYNGRLFSFFHNEVVTGSLEKKPLGIKKNDDTHLIVQFHDGRRAVARIGVIIERSRQGPVASLNFEGDRAIITRRSAYAYKNEEWWDLVIVRRDSVHATLLADI